MGAMVSGLFEVLFGSDPTQLYTLVPAVTQVNLAYYSMELACFFPPQCFLSSSSTLSPSAFLQDPNQTMTKMFVHYDDTTIRVSSKVKSATRQPANSRPECLQRKENIFSSSSWIMKIYQILVPTSYPHSKLEQKERPNLSTCPFLQKKKVNPQWRRPACLVHSLRLGFISIVYMP